NDAALMDGQTIPSTAAARTGRLGGAMGFFDRLKKMLGGEGDAGEAPAEVEGAEGEGAPRSQSPTRKRKGERPPLAPPAAPSATLDDALEARDAGDKEKSRAILRAIDRGAGLRTVLRAAAALEAKDEAELGPLLEALAHAEAPGRLHLQLAAAMGGEEPAAAAQIDRGKTLGAPAWAMGWARAATADDEGRRGALVDMLFDDPAFARTVAARDLKIEGAHEDASAIARYASLDAGRAAIHRFGVDPVRALVARIDGGAGGAKR